MRVARFVVPLVLLSGCFAFFPLGDYGPADGASDEGGADAIATDAPRTDAKDPDVDPGPIVGRIFFVLDPGVAGGDLMGVDAADALCNAAAKDAGPEGHRARSYRAWLGGKNNNGEVASRWDASVLVAPDGGTELPLVMPDRRTIALGFAELADSGPKIPIVVDVRGNALPVTDAGCVEGGVVWTATTPNGTSTGQDCAGWQFAGANGSGGAFGQIEGGAWTEGCPGIPCNVRGYLYCVEQ